LAQRIIDPRIRLRHIACFLEVARLRSVVEGARVLNISQPAASKTIKELEEVLGGELFDRSRRTLTLTGFGDVFYRYASNSLASLRLGMDAVKGNVAGTIVRVGALPTVSARLLPAAVAAFTADHPNIRVQVVTGPNEHLLNQLRTAEMDFIIGRMAEPSAMVGLAFEPLYSERVVMVVRRGHPLLGQQPFALHRLEPYQIMMPTRGAVIRPLVDRMLLANGVSNLRDQIETVSDAFGRAYVQETDAIWIISEGVVARDVAEGDMVLLPVDTSETLGPVGFTTRGEVVSELRATLLMDVVREKASKLREL
jgi:LysR family pca operon transcriptional activator